jgi:hypothetical protein
MHKSPRVFISYSHDDAEHQEWVYSLACKLRNNGVDVILDQWDLALGSNLANFMESGLSAADRVLVICTDEYNRKSDNLLCGVGYEKNIISAEILQKAETIKFIPCLRRVGSERKTPLCLAGRKYLDLSSDEEFEARLASLLHEIHGVPERPKPKIGPNPFGNNSSNEVARLGSTTFFSRRFEQAFPGVRGIEWFREPELAVERLKILFQDPIASDRSNPIWWWRGGNMSIKSFSALPPDLVYLDDQELLLDEVAAVNKGGYFRQFLYIKTKASHPSGLSLSKAQATRLESGSYLAEEDAFVMEEYAEYRGKPVTLAEFDDGAAVIDGKVVHIAGKATRRIKFLTPYNLIIAPHHSPINNQDFDKVLVQHLDAMLRSSSKLEDLVDIIRKLPRHPAEFG